MSNYIPLLICTGKCICGKIITQEVAKNHIMFDKECIDRKIYNLIYFCYNSIKNNYEYIYNRSFPDTNIILELYVQELKYIFHNKQKVEELFEKLKTELCEEFNTNIKDNNIDTLEDLTFIKNTFLNSINFINKNVKQKSS